MTHYFEGRSGDSFADATLHATDDCAELDGPVRPLADSSVPDDATMCGECSDVEDADESEVLHAEGDAGPDAGTETDADGAICTCDVGEACDRCGGDCPEVKTDDEVCGRERPCPYHD